MKSISRHRRPNKPIMEKKRRNRINDCLVKLKSILMNSMQTDSAQYSKLEKADILELTVNHLMKEQRDKVLQGADNLTRYRVGFAECAHEVDRFLREDVDEIKPEVASKLLNHLTKVVSSTNNASSGVPQQQKNVDSVPQVFVSSGNIPQAVTGSYNDSAQFECCVSGVNQHVQSATAPFMQVKNESENRSDLLMEVAVNGETSHGECYMQDNVDRNTPQYPAPEWSYESQAGNSESFHSANYGYELEHHTFESLPTYTLPSIATLKASLSKPTFEPTPEQPFKHNAYVFENSLPTIDMQNVASYNVNTNTEFASMKSMPFEIYDACVHSTTISSLSRHALFGGIDSHVAETSNTTISVPTGETQIICISNNAHEDAVGNTIGDYPNSSESDHKLKDNSSKDKSTDKHMKIKGSVDCKVRGQGKPALRAVETNKIRVAEPKKKRLLNYVQTQNENDFPLMNQVPGSSSRYDTSAHYGGMFSFDPSGKVWRPW